MPYDIDPEFVPFMEMLPAFETTDRVEVRRLFAAMVAQQPPYEPPVPLIIVDQTIPGPDGAPPVTVRVYTPEIASNEPLPAVLYIHGGGFTIGSIETEHANAASVAAEAEAVVVSVEYRLAPEDPFPAGLDDCYAALEWVAKQSHELGIDLGRLAVRGSSAGGGLAAAVALMARDRGGPALCFQFLGIPELDDRLETPSMTDYVDTPLWNRPGAINSWTDYLGAAPGGPDVSPYAAPARAQDLSGLPPAYVSVCEFDPLRDEGMLYAQRLVQAGVHTELHLYPGTFHGSSSIAHAAVSLRMAADDMTAMRRGLQRR